MRQWLEANQHSRVVVWRTQNASLISNKFRGSATFVSIAEADLKHSLVRDWNRPINKYMLNVNTLLITREYINSKLHLVLSVPSLLFKGRLFKRKQDTVDADSRPTLKAKILKLTSAKMVRCFKNDSVQQAIRAPAYDLRCPWPHRPTSRRSVSLALTARLLEQSCRNNLMPVIWMKPLNLLMIGLHSAKGVCRYIVPHARSLSYFIYTPCILNFHIFFIIMERRPPDVTRSMTGLVF